MTPRSTAFSITAGSDVVIQPKPSTVTFNPVFPSVRTGISKLVDDGAAAILRPIPEVRAEARKPRREASDMQFLLYRVWALQILYDKGKLYGTPIFAP